jgi:hypothetical protein
MTTDNALDILSIAILDKKFMNVAYITATYSENEIIKLIDACTLVINDYDRVIKEGNESKLHMTKFQAFFVKTFLESQSTFLIKAFNWVQNNFEFETIEGNCFDFELCQN